MLIENEFVVPQPLEKVWAFFNDIPQVAACLPQPARAWAHACLPGCRHTTLALARRQPERL